MTKIILTSLKEIPSNLISSIAEHYPHETTLNISSKTIEMVFKSNFQSNDKKMIQDLAEKNQTDVIFLKNEYIPNETKVFVFDMDSTLINIECIDEIARECGKVSEVSKITEASMRGEIKNFNESLIARVKLLKGASSEILENVYQKSLRLNLGAENLIQFAHQHGIKTLLVSGGFTFFSERVKQMLGLDEAHSNTLEIIDGVITGNVLGKIVDGDQKAFLVEEFCKKHQVLTTSAVVFGDGSNDLKMMELAGLSLGFRPKPIIKEKADGTLNFVGLDGITEFLSFYA